MTEALYRLQKQGKAWFLVPLQAALGHTRTTCPGPMRAGVANGARVLVSRAPDGNVQSVTPVPADWAPPLEAVTRPLFRRGYFANPYNFVPFSTKLRELEGLDHHQPLSHAAGATDTFRAKLSITLTTKTPLLTMELKGKQLGQPTVLSVRRDLDGRPVVPGSSIKGMLRAVYEQVTGSRLGIFSHDKPESVRVTHTDAPKLKFAKVTTHDASNGALTLTTQGDLVPSAVTSQLEIVSPVSVLQTDVGARPHGRWVYAWLQLLEHHYDGAHYLWWRVVGGLHDAAPSPASPPAAPPTPSVKNVVVDTQALVLVRGTLHVTGRTFGRKKSERLHVEQVVAGPATVANLPDMQLDGDCYRRTVQAWRGKLASFNREPPNGPGLVTGSYVRDTSWERLDPGQTVYYRRGSERVELYPAMITRESALRSPAELLPSTLAPAAGRAELSPAERLFGWVPPRGSQERPHRGQLRIGGVQALDEPQNLAGDLTWRLATLNSPKPSHARFYTRDHSGNPTHGRPKSDGFKAEDQLAGHKVYPHQHRHDSYWTRPERGWPINGHEHEADTEGHFKNYLSPPGANPNVAVAIADWVDPGSRFSFTVYVENVTRTELAALLWVLNLTSDGDHFLKLGMGKPLGFGSVQLGVDWERTTLQTSDQVRRGYSALGHEPSIDAELAKTLVGEFDLALRGKAPKVYQSIWAAAAGTSMVVHYPRIPQERYGAEAPPQAESYKWFVQNEPTGTRNDRANAHALPLLYRADQPDRPEALPVEPTQSSRS